MTISYVEARAAPLLEREKERYLLREWQQKGSKAALEELVVSHARLVYTIVRKLKCSQNDQEEMISEGLFGLIKAANAFELDRDVRFSTYARWWVRNSVAAANARLNSVVDVPYQPKDDDGTIATFMPKDLAYIDMENEGVDAFESPDPTPEEQMIVESSRLRMREHIVHAMENLCEIERDVVVSRSLLARPATVEDLARRYNVSRERLRQLERRAMAKLKYELLSRGISSVRVG